MNIRDVPALLANLSTLCAKADLDFRYRKAGSIKSLKTPCNGQCICRVICGGSIVITGLDAVSDEVWLPVADEMFRVSTGGWTYCR